MKKPDSNKAKVMRIGKFTKNNKGEACFVETKKGNWIEHIDGSYEKIKDKS